MRYLIVLVAVLFPIVAQAAMPLMTIKLSGTVEVQDAISPGVTKVRVSRLDAKRVFAEFSVSGDDYALVIDASGPGVVELVPKRVSAALPTIEVFSLSGNLALIDTEKAFGDFNANVGSPAVGNLFEGLTGVVNGRVSFKGSIASGILKKFTFSSLAVGKNQSGVTNQVALLKFKVATSKVFTQLP